MSSAEPVVSVLIASYNHGRFIAEAVEAVLAQTWRELEVIAIDDGSTDDSPQILRRYEADPRFKLIVQPNAGLPTTLNRALALATGKYVAVCSSDDVWLPNKTEAQVAYLESTARVIAAATNVVEIDTEGRELSRPTLRAGEFGFEDFLLSRHYFPAPTAMLHRTVLQSAGGFETRFRMEDWPTWLKLTQRGERFGLIPIYGAKYRLHGTNMHRSIEKMLLDRERVLELYAGHPKIDAARIENDIRAIYELAPIDRWSTLNRVLTAIRTSPKIVLDGRITLALTRMSLPKPLDARFMTLVSAILRSTQRFRRRTESTQ